MHIIVRILAKLNNKSGEYIISEIIYSPIFHKEKDIMRLDKYLKISRIIKRRTIANEACDAGRVLVNGKTARASYDVKIGDIIEIQLGTKPIKAEIISINEYAKKEEASDMYKILV